MIEIKGNSNNKASVIQKPVQAYIESGENAVFYVRPFDAFVESELERLMRDTKRMANMFRKEANNHVTITQLERGRLYRIEADHPISMKEYPTSFWGILHKMFCGYAREICVETMTQARYYKAIVANEYIEQKTKLYVA